MNLEDLDRHDDVLQKRLIANGARLREHLIGWLGRQGLSPLEAEAVVDHALTKGVDRAVSGDAGDYSCVSAD